MYQKINDSNITKWVVRLLITSNFILSVSTNPHVVWIRMENNSNSLCFDVVSFTLEVFFSPPVDTLGMLIGCSSVVLPPLTNVNYFTIF